MGELKWRSISSDPPAIGQRIIGMTIMPATTAIYLYNGNYSFNFDYPNPALNYPSATRPTWWIPAPEWPE